MPEIDEFGSTKEDIASGLYGFELSTDLFSKVTPFISYRKDIDLSYFANTTGDNELNHKGQILSVGVRLKRKRYSKPQYREHVASRPQREAKLDSIVPRFSFD